MRLTKFGAVRKLLFCDWKTIAMMIRPTMIGSEPSSPDRTPAHQLRDCLAERPGLAHLGGADVAGRGRAPGVVSRLHAAHAVASS